MPILGGPIDFYHGFKNEDMQPIKNHDPIYEKLMQAYNYCFSAVTVWAFLLASLSDLKFPVKDSWYIVMVLFFLVLYTTSFLLNANEDSIEHQILTTVSSILYLFAPAALTLIYSLSKWGILCTSASIYTKIFLYLNENHTTWNFWNHILSINFFENFLSYTIAR